MKTRLAWLGWGLALAGLAITIAVTLSPTSVTAAPAPEPVWLLGPETPGPDLPPVGRSLFDHLMTEGTGADKKYVVPWPFQKLLEKIQAKLPQAPPVDEGAEYREAFPFIGPWPFQPALIPFGRSLQRVAAKPDWREGVEGYFTFPRVVVTVDVHAKQSLPRTLGYELKDRIFIGFHEGALKPKVGSRPGSFKRPDIAAGVMEVISYNELAGRYEFQIVRNYKKGMKPEVYYGSRELCLQCHKGHAPIFARNPWSETNANDGPVDSPGDPKKSVYRRLVQDLDASKDEFPALPERLATRKIRDNNDRVTDTLYYYGIPVVNAKDETYGPYAIDSAAQRANAIMAQQKLWSDLCVIPNPTPGTLTPAKCRAETLKYVMQAVLNGDDRFDARSPAFEASYVPTLLASWTQRWPGGVKLQNPNVEDRNPLNPPPAELRRAQAQATLSGETRSTLEELFRRSGIPKEYEPSEERAPQPPPAGVWQANEKNRSGLFHLITGFVDFFTPAERAVIDEKLFALGSAAEAPRRQYALSCRVQVLRSPPKVTFQCNDPKDFEPAEGQSGTARVAGSVRLRNGEVRRETLSSLTTMTFRGRGEQCETNAPSIDLGADFTRLNLCASASNLELTGRVTANGTRRSLSLVPYSKIKGVHARLPDGNAVGRVVLEWNEEGAGASATLDATGYVEVLGDFASLARAIDDAEAQVTVVPFRRGTFVKELFAKLGIAENVEVLGERAEDVAGQAETEPLHGATGNGGEFAAEVALFRNRCQRCHRDSDAPPAFTRGDDGEVERKLRHCAERIYYRLNDESMPLGNPITPAQRNELKAGIERILAAELVGNRPSGQTDAARRSALDEAQRTQLPARLNRIKAAPTFDDLRECLP